MRVTVLTPSKNQANFIDACLRSVHEQTYRTIEHIVLDGMSTDDTALIAARYPCAFFQRKDSGPAQAINQGLNMASGDIVCWLNADDAFSSQTTIERIIRIFAEQPEVDVITGDGYYINEQGRYINPIVMTHPSRVSYKWIIREDFILQPATFWRRNAFRLDERLKYCFDWQLWIDYFAAGLNILYVPQYFALYRRQPSSLTQQDTASRRREVYKMVKKHRNHGLLVVWCWLMWRSYQLSEVVRVPRLKRLMKVANALMKRVSYGFIVSS